MKTILNNYSKILLICAMVIVLGFSFGYVSGSDNPGDNNTMITLKSPPFVGNAIAGSSVIGEILDDEAGISAWYQGDVIDLNDVRGVFRTIELETSEYIIGSVPFTNEHFDVHAYVHIDGWILAYYMNNEPASKMIHANLQTINSTRFTTVISTLASAAGIPFTGETYYDFRFPNATNMIFVAEDENNGNDFLITLPSDYGYFERSWYAYDTQDEVDFYLDGTNLWYSATWQGGTAAYGFITAAQLLPDIPHRFAVETSEDVYAVLVITYRVP